MADTPILIYYILFYVFCLMVEPSLVVVSGTYFQHAGEVMLQIGMGSGMSRAASLGGSMVTF